MQCTCEAILNEAINFVAAGDKNKVIVILCRLFPTQSRLSVLLIWRLILLLPVPLLLGDGNLSAPSPS